MTKFTVESNELILKLAELEKVVALYSDFHTPFFRSSKANIGDNFLEIICIKTGFKVNIRGPGYAGVATVRLPDYKTFIDNHCNTTNTIVLL